MLDKSSLFINYNAARTLVRDGLLDSGRLNRALGLAQTKHPVLAYRTTSLGCTCPDAQYRPNLVCKHRLSLFLQGGY